MQHRYCLADDSAVDQGYLKRHFGKVARKVVKDAMCKARISAIVYYCKKKKGMDMHVNGSGAGQIYLTEQEYLQSKVDWICKDSVAWAYLARLWSSPEWIAKSKAKRDNQGSDPKHKYGGDGHAVLEKRMVS